MNYLLRGPEEYKKRQFLKKLKKSLLDDKTREFNFEMFQAQESEISKILDSLSTIPLLAVDRIVVINDVEKFNASERESILKYLKNPCEKTTLVLSSSVTGFNKFLSEISGFVKVISSARLGPGEINAWIRRKFTERGKSLSFDLANTIRERIGHDLLRLENEIEKVSTFAKDAREITGRDIEAVLGGPSYETVFQLVDFLTQKRLDRVFAAMEELMRKEKPLVILAILAWHFRRAGDKKKLEILLEGDVSIKRGTMLPEDALDRVMVRLCERPYGVS